jgi:hypothetical protein
MPWRVQSPPGSPYSGDFPLIEYLFKDEIVHIAFTDKEFHYISIGSKSRHCKKIYIQELPVYQGPPEKYRIKLAHRADGWHNPWRPDGFFTQVVGGKTCHCFMPHPSIPLGDNDDLIVVSEANRRITAPAILEAIAGARVLARGDLVRYKATLGNQTEIGTWRANRQQFEANLDKLLAPGAACEILWEGKFSFDCK